MNRLAELIGSAVARSPGSVVSDRRTCVTLADAVRRAGEVAVETRRLCDRSDVVVAVVLPSSCESVVHLLAAVLGDYTTCFVDPSSEPSRVDEILAAVDADIVVDDAGTARRRSRRAATWNPGYIAMSSGSTGAAPKAVLSTWTCIADFVPHGAEALQLDSLSRWAEPSHLAYDLAMTNCLLVLAAGASLHLTSSLADRLRPLAFAARAEATHLRLAPRFIDLAVAEHGRGGPTNLLVWGSGGDRLSPRQARSVLGMGVPTLVNTYGTSETAGFASAATFTVDDLGAEDLGAVHGTVTVGSGHLGPWQVETVPYEVDGVMADLLAVRSPQVDKGYIFGGGGQPFPRWDQDRVVTGDLGTRVDGKLFCFGRAGRLVKRSATFVNLDDVDRAIERSQGLATFTVMTRSGRMVTLVEGAAHVPTVVRARLTSVVKPDTLPDTVVPVRLIPRLGNGKTDHAKALTIAEAADG